MAKIDYTYNISNSSSPSQTEVEQCFTDIDDVVDGELDETNFFKDALVSVAPVRVAVDISATVWTAQSIPATRPYIKFRPSNRLSYLEHLAFAYQTYTSGTGIAVSVSDVEKIEQTAVGTLPNSHCQNSKTSRVVYGDTVSVHEPSSGGTLVVSGVGLELGFVGVMPS